MRADAKPEVESPPLNVGAPHRVEGSGAEPGGTPGGTAGGGRPPGRRARGAVAALWRHAPTLVFALGAALRLRQYLYGRSLWVDEAFLSLNVAERSFAGLVRPLGWDQ